VTWLTAPGTLPPNSSTMSGTGTFTPAAGSFSTAGTYTYECTIHGSIMSGQVIVQ
jgi:plastocyanin